MKCAICNREIGTTFLKKIRGNYIHYKGKQYVICNECMKKFKTKDAIISELEKLKK